MNKVTDRMIDLFTILRKRKKGIDKVMIALILLIIVFLILLILTAPVKSEPIDLNDPTDLTVYDKAGITIVARRYTPPDTYELLFRTTYEDRMIVEQWKEVTEFEFREYSRMNNRRNKYGN